MFYKTIKINYVIYNIIKNIFNAIFGVWEFLSEKEKKIQKSQKTKNIKRIKREKIKFVFDSPKKKNTICVKFVSKHRTWKTKRFKQNQFEMKKNKYNWFKQRHDCLKETNSITDNTLFVYYVIPIDFDGQKGHQKSDGIRMRQLATRRTIWQ